MVDIAYMNGVMVEDYAGTALREIEEMKKRTPLSTHQEMENLGIPWVCRLEFPIRSQMHLDQVADELMGLATRLKAIRHNKSLDDVDAARQAHRAARNTFGNLRDLKKKVYGKSRQAVAEAAIPNFYPRPPKVDQDLKQSYKGTKSSGSTDS